MIHATLDKPPKYNCFLELLRKFFVLRLNNKRVNPSKQPHSGVTFVEKAHWLLKRMIKVVSDKSNENLEHSHNLWQVTFSNPTSVRLVTLARL